MAYLWSVWGLHQHDLPNQSPDPTVQRVRKLSETLRESRCVAEGSPTASPAAKRRRVWFLLHEKTQEVPEKGGCDLSIRNITAIPHVS